MLLEFDIIIAAIKADFSGLDQSDSVFKEKSVKQISFPNLFELAHHHGCVWEVMAYCKFHHLLDQNELERARALTMQSTVHAMRNEKKLLGLTEIFVKENIPYALLKGAAIFPQFRATSEQASRQSADIDVLVGSDKLKQVIKMLLEQGFECDEIEDPLLISDFVEKHENWFKHRDMSFSMHEQAVNVDLHWQVAYPFSLPMATKEVLARTERVEIQQHPVNCLSFNDHFILLCIHGYLDRFFILKHLADIYWAKHHPRFDFEAIRVHAKQYGVVEQVESACATAEVFFNSSNTNNTYAHLVSHRYEKYAYKPPRMHPGHGEWSLQDKIAYIKHQLQTRSTSVGLLTPILHRLKYDVSMVKNIPKGFAVWFWWPFAYIQKIFQR